MKYLLSLFIVFFINFSSAAVITDSSAPNFELTNSYGGDVSLESFKGSTVVLEWTNHDCPYVAKHYRSGNMQNTQDFAQKEQAIWITIISSAPGTQGYVLPEEANHLTSSRKATPHHVLFDPEGTVGKMYGAKTTPHMYIIDSKGTLRYQGAIDNAEKEFFKINDFSKSRNYVKEALKEIGLNKSVTDRTTKPYGCSVKYKS